MLNPYFQLMSPSSVTSNVTPCPTAGDRVTHNVMVVVISSTSDAVYRTVQLCLCQPTQGEMMCEGLHWWLGWLNITLRNMVFLSSIHTLNNIIGSRIKPPPILLSLSLYFILSSHLTVGSTRILSLVCVSLVMHGVLEDALEER